MADNEIRKRWLDSWHFIKVHQGKLIFWDYKNHNQFEIEPAYLSRLVELSAGAVLKNNSIDNDLLDAGILVDHQKQWKWGWDWLSHIFHNGTCHPSMPQRGISKDISDEYARSYLTYCESLKHSMPQIEVLKNGKLIELNEVENIKFESLSLWDTLKRRRTCRDFDGTSIDLQDASNILHAAFGDQKSSDPTLPAEISVYGYKRTSPSAGGLQCVEPYLWVMNINGLKPGIYHYLSQRHQLEVISDRLPECTLGEYLCNQQWANDMAFAIIITCRLDKMWWKYPHSRAYRAMLMEVGHISQTLNLCIVASGLHPWMTGYFHDKEIAELLACDPDIEIPMFVVGAGNGSGSSMPRNERELLTSGWRP